MQYRISTPVLGFTGISAGVNFTNGVAELDVPEDNAGDELRYNARALAYFRSQGYGVEEIDETPAPEPSSEPDDSDKPPTRSASKADWLAYAITQGVDADEADKLTRDQLAERFLDTKGPTA
ncbi:hypothetical protein [Streptomyces sp. NPDC058614]|uniref:hypothetical protein n=1 Tax=Streptomyces sp. NPDC058614 TaxID=3346557 RepID=UPI003669DA5C